MPAIDHEEYLGRKRLMGPRIIGHMPRHKFYVEGFLGSGEIMRQKPRAQKSTGIELDAAVIGVFTYPSANIINTCAIEYLEGLLRQGRPLHETFIYLDPPYHPDTRTSTHGYKCELMPGDHKRLLAVICALTELGAMIMLSGYDCELYSAALIDWRRVDYDVMTRGGMRVESLWMNYAQPKAFWPSQIGDNKQQRQDFKRRVKSMASKYASMNEAQRLACMAALCAVDAT